MATRALSSLAIVSGTTTEEDIATALGMNWDSTNSVAYMGEDVNNGFKFTLSGTTLRITPWVAGAVTPNYYDAASPIVYIINDDNTACMFGNTGILYAYFAWMKADNPSDSDTHYIYAGSRTSGSMNYGWSDGDRTTSLAKEMVGNNASMVSLAPFLTAGVNNVAKDGFYLIVGDTTTQNAQFFSLDGYDYIRSAQTNVAQIRIVIRLGKS